jgi:hypothetical protein
MTRARAALDVGAVTFDVHHDTRIPRELLSPIGAVSVQTPDAPDAGARIELFLAESDVIDAPTGRPSFFHGRVRVFVDDDTSLTIDDGAARVVVAPGGSVVQARLSRAALAPGSIFARTTMNIALVLALRWRERFHIHAGLCELPDGRAVLLVGPSGAGKSTTTALLGEAGLRMCSDDACLLARKGDLVFATPLARAFHLAAALLPRLPGLAGHGWDEIAPGRVEARTPPPPSLPRSVAQVIVVSPDRLAQTRIARLSPADGLAGLIESSALVAAEGLPHARAHFDVLGLLARQARFVALTPGPDFFDRPRAIWNAMQAAFAEPPS